MSVKYHNDVLQGSDEWLELRRGILTASEMKHILTPAKLQYASNDKERAHVYEILAQRITGYVEPQYIGDDMMRGWEDEVTARDLYGKHYAPVQEVGFVTNDRWGFTIGYSPDGLVGEDGLIEIKSRRQKFQIETIIDGGIPQEYMLQAQTGLLVTGRKWLDFISYSGGIHMFVTRVLPDYDIHDAIVEAATKFEIKVTDKLEIYNKKIAEGGLIPTVRKIYEEMTL